MEYLDELVLSEKEMLALALIMRATMRGTKVSPAQVCARTEWKDTKTFTNKAKIWESKGWLNRYQGRTGACLWDANLERIQFSKGGLIKSIE